MRPHAIAFLAITMLVGCVAPREVARAPAMPTVLPVAPAPRAEEREQALLAETLTLARGNRIADALGKIADIADPTLRARVAMRATGELAENDAASAAALAAGLPAGPAQTAGVEHAARAWASREPAAALRWSTGIADPVAAGVAQRAIAEVGASSDPRALLERIAALPEGPAQADLRAAAAAAWARRDPEVALDWLRTQREEARLRSAVTFAVAQTNPGRASLLAEQLPEGRDRWLLLTMIGQTWVAQDRPAAMEWAGRLSVSAERDAAFAGIETGLGVPSSRRRSGGPGQRTIRSRGAGGGSGAPLRPEFSEFAAWLGTQPPERNREEAMLEFVRQRGALDTGAMGQWLASLPGSTTRDRALEIYLDGRLTSTPAEAAAWLRSLPRSDVNDAMVDQVARRWLRSDPAAATTWLRDLAIPEFQKERLLREAGR